MKAVVRVGDWRGERAVIGEIARVHPPGLVIESLMSDWTQRTFLAAAADPSPPALPRSAADGGFAGRLAPDLDDAPAGATTRWTLYFEVVDTPGTEAKTSERSEIDLFFGARGGASSQSLRVLSDGSLVEVRGGQSTSAGRAKMVRGADRTSYWIRVPEKAIEPGRVLRLGLVHVDGAGRRSAWPRPMIPWQTEPGRIAIDLSSWSPIKE